MSHSHPNKHIPYCLNCHYPLVEMDSFCPNCGQKPTDGKATMHDLMHEFTHTLFHIDGKFFTTLKHIFIPGKLTEEFFKGHHKRYAHPVQLFLVLGGIFLIVIAKLTHELEDKLKEELQASSKKTEQKRLLAELDSTAQSLASYQNNPSVRKGIDSLLSEKYAELDRESSKSITRNYNDLSAQLIKERLVVNDLKLKIDTIDPKKLPALKAKLTELEIELTSFEKDSAELVAVYAQSNKVNVEQGQKELTRKFIEKYRDKGLKVSINGENILNPKDSLMHIYQKIAEELKEDVHSEVIDIMNNLAVNENPANEFMKGFKNGYKNAKKEKIESSSKELSKPNNSLRKTVQKDSMGIAGTTIAISDIQDLNTEQVIEKYHVEGFWKRRVIARTIMAKKSGSDMLHTFFSKFLWIIVFSLLPTAGMMWLLYRRQKRYFVEHLVWLLHINCLFFILFPLVLIDSNWAFPGALTYTILCIILPFLALKRYYNQGWGKTFAKYVLFTFGYYTIGSIVFVLGGALSFLFF